MGLRFTEKKRWVIGVALFLSLFTTVLVFLGVFHFAQKNRPMGITNFQLNFRGESWQFTHQVREINLIYFGYTQCPDVCPLTLSLIGEAFHRLSSEERAKMRFIFINVDFKHAGERDAADYVTNFHPDFIGLSGTEQQIEQVIRNFPASYSYHEDPNSYLGYSIAHTDRVFILNKNGAMVGSIPGSKSQIEEIVNLLREYL